MLVEVRLLRRHGVKLAREDLFQAPPHCGHLSLRTRFVDPWPPPWEKGTSADAFLGRRPDFAWDCTLHLQDCRLNRVRGPEFVLVGREGSKGSDYSGQPYPQAWWCRLITGPRVPAPPANKTPAGPTATRSCA